MREYFFKNQIYFYLQNHCRWWLRPWNWKTLTPWKESYDQPGQHIKKQRHFFADKSPSSQSYSFSSSRVWMWELDHKESRVPKNWCFWTVVLEKTLESPLDCKEIHPVHYKGNQSWVFFGRNDAKAEAQVLWPPRARWPTFPIWLIGKDSDAGRDCGEVEKRMTEDEMAGWHHRLNGRLSELRELVMDREAWRAAVAKSRTWLSDWTELNWTEGWSAFLRVKWCCFLNVRVLPESVMHLHLH